MIRLKRTNYADPDFLSLVTLLDQELWSLYEDKQGIFAPHNKLNDQVCVVVAFHSETPVACGAFRPTPDATTIEVKRMFVHTAYRGKGLSKQVLQDLETWAQEQKYTRAILETGIKQPQAIGLYERAGYKRISSYGPYQDAEESVCMEKLFGN